MLTLVLATALAAEPSALAPTVLVAPPTVTGPLDAQEVWRGVSAAEVPVLACIADPVHPLPLDVKSLPVSWAVRPDGKVDRLVVRGLETLPDHQACLTKALGGATFPARPSETLVSTQLSLSGPSSMSGHLTLLDLAGLLGATSTTAPSSGAGGVLGGVIGTRGTSLGGDPSLSASTSGGSGSFGTTGGGTATMGSTPVIVGALDRSLVDAVLKRNLAQIRYCYQRELTKNPQLAGRIAVRFTIAPDGSVSSAEIAESTMDNELVPTCLTGRFLRFVFPAPRNQKPVIVTYPITFSPG